MNENGIKTALKSSEVQGQTAEFEKIQTLPGCSEKQSDLFLQNSSPALDHILPEQPSQVQSVQGNSCKEISATSGNGALFNETMGSGLEERKAGRPKGAKNKSTKEWVEYFTNKFESPLIALGKLYTQDTKQLARTMCCDRIDALKLQISAATAVLPYVHQKQPIAIETHAEELPTINIFTSQTMFNKISNGSNQVKREIIIDGIASTSVDEIDVETIG